MEILKYKVISTKAQYIDYCKKLETLVFSQVKNKNLNDECSKIVVFYCLNFCWSGTKLDHKFGC